MGKVLQLQLWFQVCLFKCTKMSEQQAKTRTIARLPRCWQITACRTGDLYCVCETYILEARFLRISRSGDVEALPFSYKDDGWNSVACSPDGNAIFIGTSSGQILIKTPVWDSAPPELVVDRQDDVCALKACEEG
jgi:hypothetical protein